MVTPDDVQPQYCGAWNPVPVNEAEHCQEAAERYNRQYQFHQAQAKKWRQIFIDHWQRTGQAETVIRQHTAQATEYLRLARLAESRLSQLGGV